VARGLASADTIDVTGVDGNLGESGFWINENGQNTPLYFGGVIDIKLNSGGKSYDRYTLCVDLFTDIDVGGAYDTTVLSPGQAALMTGKVLERVAWLVDNVLVPVQDSSITSQLPSADWLYLNPAAPPEPAQGAGLQLAIWDITEAGGDGFSSWHRAVFYRSKQPHAIGRADLGGNLSRLKHGQELRSRLRLRKLSTGTTPPQYVQMLEGPMYADGPQPVPEPSSFAMLGGMLIALAGLVRMR